MGQSRDREDQVDLRILGCLLLGHYRTILSYLEGRLQVSPI